MAICGQPELGPGPPWRYALEVQLLVMMRLDLPYRALEAISGIDAVTASRRVRRMLERLKEVPLAKGPVAEGGYLVDTTTVRVRARQDQYYSGYKHHRGVKTQVLADKAYAGAFLEGEGLVRLFRHHEREYRAQPEQAKAFNKELSRRRVRIEHVMASLKRFRLLGGRFSLALACYPAVMKVAALIHNLERVEA